MSTLQEGQLLLERIREMGIHADVQNRHATTAACYGIEHLLELLQDRRRHLEELWLQRKLKLEQCLQLLLLDEEVKKVRLWTSLMYICVFLNIMSLQLMFYMCIYLSYLLNYVSIIYLFTMHLRYDTMTLFVLMVTLWLLSFPVCPSRYLTGTTKLVTATWSAVS